MQGFTTEADSVGGSGGGIRTANLRAIGSQYTLTLLDGRRRWNGLRDRHGQHPLRRA